MVALGFLIFSQLFGVLCFADKTVDDIGLVAQAGFIAIRVSGTDDAPGPEAFSLLNDLAPRY